MQDFQEDDVSQSNHMTCTVKFQKGDSNCNPSNSPTQNRFSENNLRSVNVDNRLCSFTGRTNVHETGHSHQGVIDTHRNMGGTRAGTSDIFNQNNNSRHVEHCSTASISSNSYQFNPTRTESTCATRARNAYGCTSKVNVTTRPARACVGTSIDKSNISPPSENSTPRERKRSKRKFPGPAGVLPKLSSGQSLDNSITATVQSPARVVHDDQDQTMASSQSGDDMFNDGPWHRMLADIGPNGDNILQKFSIVDVLAKARRKQLPQMRAPLVIGVIESIDSQGHDTCVTIRDKSGSMKGTFHHQLMKDYEAEIHLGTVLVLRQVGVISPSSRNHYLNITSTNIILLYNAQSSDGSTEQHANVQDYSKLRDVVKEAEFQKQTLENTHCVSTRSAATTEIRCQGTLTASNMKQPRCESTCQYTSPVVNNKIPRSNTIIPEKCNTPDTSAAYGVDTTPRRSIYTSESMLSEHLPSSSTKSKWNFKQKSNVGMPKIPCSTSGTGGISKDVDQFSIGSQSQLMDSMTSTPAHIPPPPRLVMLGSNTDSRQQTKLNKNVSTAQNSATDLCARVYQLKPTPACQPDNHKPPAFSIESLWQDDLSDDLLSQLSEEM